MLAALAGDKDHAEQRIIAGRALCITFLIILVCSAFGESIFHLFGITLAELAQIVELWCF
ncbi:MAG: hypothetical protein LJE64_00535 [Desulfofustis sp.]|jgi:small neutral amino acid transporter SnatA (MarC family)|nr:hypothetical protein [Desulfofustis sp.]